MANILLVDDDQTFVDTTRELLELLGHSVATATSFSSAKEIISSRTFDHLILDLILPDGSGLHLLDAIEDQNASSITLVTGHPSVKALVKDLLGPNISYLIKPIDLKQLKAAISSTRRTNVKSDSSDLHFGCLVGESKPMHRLYEQIRRVAKTKANVMLMGESGVGKEMVAAAVHTASQVKGELVATNCGAFSGELIASELFGHEKGAFTGAIQRKEGVFEQAIGGTLFLDEVTEMPIDQQPSLLRVLETQKLTRTGGTTLINVDCRVVSATNRSEAQLAKEKCLREDLYYRLAVFPISIPPLRQRKEDIPLLVAYFLKDFNEEYGANIGVSDEAMDRLSKYDWPGNVRELRHAIHRAYIMADDEQELIVLPDDFSSPFSQGGSEASPGIAVGKTVEDVERELIQSTLSHYDGDKKTTADVLGVSLKTLYNRLNSYAEEQV
ncbi:sigma-54 dependent transcriptional regulator [Gilvimarinus sp. SDUM040013]|uniref:Sigma-54 dependent transcriptional regulator n=1 Tax=Gilvimarinus gilvus TaxID=3058038 RepID=A0ABU4RYB1_9GAMM|nr:sigma-54 dependent transcriptional regulator [Gilvimarinus sp. SDUM040013]MDO3388510.1 sigma-54 dependent transcriptional regulator [Gilvimarinus sp. SDUM040013]MDX6848618.1 sigma-54 dependent transcriptional regulator [Gilvimarinus sp. SDUM040013]